MIQITQFFVAPTASLLIRSNPRRVAMLVYSYTGGTFYIGPQCSLLGNAAAFTVSPNVPLAILLRHYGELLAMDWWCSPGVASAFNIVEVIQD